MPTPPLPPDMPTPPLPPDMPTPPLPSLELSPTQGTVGTIVNATGTGWQASTYTEVWFESQKVADSTTSPDGMLNTSFTVPSTTTGLKPVYATQGSVRAPANSGGFTVIIASAEATIEVNPSSGPAGQMVTVTGTGWTQDAASRDGIIIWIDSLALEVAHAVADTNGEFSVSFAIPASAPEGELRIDALGLVNADTIYTVKAESPTSEQSPLLYFPWDENENPWTLTQGPHDWNDGSGSQSGLDFDKDNTPRRVLSMFSGEVTFAGLDESFTCWLTGQQTQNPTVKCKQQTGLDGKSGIFT